MDVSQSQVFRFGPFVLDIAEQRLLRNGESVPLSPKPFDLLVVFARHPGHVLDKSELIGSLWPDCSVEESNLTVAISALRKALGNATDGVSYIQTVPKRGYRFTEAVEVLVASPEPAVAAESEHAPAEAAPVRRVQLRLSHVALPMLLVAGLGTVAVLKPPRVARERIGAATIAVLPFRTLDAAGPQESDVGIAMADALITKLSNVHEVVVRPTGEVLKYVGTGSDPLGAGRELSVDSIVDGTIQRSGARVRVTVQVVSVRNGASLWAMTVDDPAGDIFSLQDSISERVAATLVPSLTQQERQRLAKRFTDNPEAYDSYQRGRYRLNQRTTASLTQAVEQFNIAIKKDPNFALAYAALADCQNLLADYQTVPAQSAAPLARAAAIQALKLDDGLAEAHAALAFVRFHYDWDWTGAEREFSRAISLNPNYATAHHWYGLFLAAMGRIDDASIELRRARELDPSSLIVATNIGWLEYLTHDFDAAIDEYQKVVERNADFAPVYYKLTWAMEQKGRLEEASTSLARALDLSGGANPGSPLTRGNAAAREHSAQIRRLRAVMMDGSRQAYMDPYNVATLSADLNDREQTLFWLDAAYRERDYWLPYIGEEPAFDRVRRDPRFQGLLQRIGLPQAPAKSP
jgi:DNA-binding winged helix-turn-helix (wHTH) protein/TolB-like protein/Flp pilus assembly protein TadD